MPKAYVIVCSADFFDSIPENHLRQLFLAFDNNGIEVPKLLEPTFQQLFEQVYHEYSNQADLNMLLAYLRLLLMHLYRLRWKQQPNGTTDERLVQLLRLLETNFVEQRQASFYAQQLGLTS